MYQTIQVSSCVSAQGELVERLPNGDALVSDGINLYRGRLISPIGQAPAAATVVRAVNRPGQEA